MAHRTLALTRAYVVRASLAWTISASLALGPFAAAQAADAVEAAYQRAEHAVLMAFAVPERPHPDVEAWREALRRTDEAVEAARAAGGEALLRALRQSARAYGVTGWYSRSWTAWIAFLDAGGTLGEGPVAVPGPGGGPIVLASDATLFAEVGTQLGFARYEAGDLDGAEPYYRRVLAQRPDEREALRWLGRIAFERGDAATALPYWQRLNELDPSDEAAAYYLERTRERLAFGAVASDHFQDGIAAYEDGALETAFDAFVQAYESNADFTEAAVWAGRAALELGRPGVAATYWQRVVQARPDDARAAWFLEVARTEQRWGVAAGDAYYRGQTAYEEGDLDTASAAFEEAVAANPEFYDAWVWAARSHQEAGRPEAAVRFWQGALERDPSDERARWFLALALQQAAFGPEAGSAFLQGLAAYQAGDAVAAEEAFRAAVEAQPEFAAAWGYLGRIAFQEGRYADAAAAYGRASELQPDDEDYAFFAEEARMLAGEGEGSSPSDQPPSTEAVPPSEEAPPESDEVPEAQEDVPTTEEEVP